MRGSYNWAEENLKVDNLLKLTNLIGKQIQVNQIFHFPAFEKTTNSDKNRIHEKEIERETREREGNEN